MLIKFKIINLPLLFILLLYFSSVISQIEEGRPVVILLTPEKTYAGSLDDDSPSFENPAIEGLYSNEREGIILNFNALEISLLNTFYNGLQVAPENQMIILAIPPGNPRDAWIKIAAILFDRFSVPSLYIHETSSWENAITPELTPGDKLYWITGNEN